MVSDLFDVVVIVFVGGHRGTVVVSDAGAFNIVVAVNLFVVAVIVFVVGGGGDCGSVVVIISGDGGGSVRCGLCHRGLYYGRGRGFFRICLYVIRGRHGWNIDGDETECFGRIFITKKYAF